MTSYTHTRITTEYLEKLHVLARANKRSATKQLEVLIDEEHKRQPFPDPRYLPKLKLADGTEVTFRAGKPKKSHRVTNFSRYDR